ncbi:MAG: hypothetical protein ACK5OX_04210 [Desertimonas sp.]
MNPIARVRHQLARRPWLYWAAVAALAVAAGVTVSDAVGRVDDARRAWGDDDTVLVAGRDGAPGDLVRELASSEARPAPMIPDGALREAPTPDAVMRQHVRAGEVLVDADVVATAEPAALVPEGWRAVAIGEPVPSGAIVGDHVEVAAGGVVLSAEGVVVGRSDGSVLVAVPRNAAATVAHAATIGEAVLLLAP